MLFDLRGKVALVAGGAGWLTKPVSRMLTQQGATVVIGDLSRDRLDQALAEITAMVPGARVHGKHFNANDETAVRDAVDATVREFGALDVMVNAAYASVGKLVEEVSADEFAQALRDNLVPAFVLARESARVMTAGGSMVMFSSMYGQVAPDPRVYVPPMKPNPIEYGVAKAGIIQMVKYLAAYWGPRGIRVNAVVPGPFPNPTVQKEEPEFVARLAGRTMLGRIGRQDDVAGCVAFLASDEAAYITGEAIAINGGWTAW